MDLQRSPFRPLIDLIVFSNLWIALAAASLYAAVVLIAGRELQVDAPLILVFSASLAGYNLLRLLALKQTDSKKADGLLMDWLRKFKWLTMMITSLASIVAAVAFYLSADSIKLVFLTAALIGIFYGFPIVKRQRLRELPLIKTFLVGTVWMLVCGLIPLLAYGYQSPLMLILICSGVFTFIVGLTIPFDIRDLAYDKQQGVITFPIKYGIEGAKRFSRLLISAAWLSFGSYLMAIHKFIADKVPYAFPDNLIYFIWLSLVLFICREQIAGLKEDNSEYSYTFVLDGMIVCLGTGMIVIHYILNNLL